MTTTTTTTTLTPTQATEIEALEAYLQAGGALRAKRRSSAHVRGKARQYAYWHAATYELAWSTRLGRIVYRYVRGGSTHRSTRVVDRQIKSSGLPEIKGLRPSTAELLKLASSLVGGGES